MLWTTEESNLRQATAILTSRRTLTSLFTRIRSSPSFSTSSRSRFPLLNHHYHSPQLAPWVPVRFQTSGSGYTPSDDSSPDCNDSPPGCDRKHWLVVMEFTNGPKPSEDQMVHSFVKTLASVLPSEEEAKKKIYSIWTTTNHPSFGALISEELSSKIEGLPGVLWVLPDSYLDVPNKDYGGDLFVDGKVIPRPQYRFTDRQQNSRPWSRPQYDKRRETMQTIRREPVQRDGWVQGQGQNVAQPAVNQGLGQSDGGFQNQGGSQGSNS
ncbi:multiple organellar RNA editing factor 3, mitochondrial-like [Bidens hawaiensis]|uniref:multiple organellar RNA editing factor 3, mitochondrial-like n=1 Tax=Bidens hawaiensis TaxID=980011 RepID=UPI00404B4AE4